MLNHKIIQKDKKLIEAIYSLSLNEQRLISIFIAISKPNGEKFTQQTISTQALAEVLGVTRELLYRDLKAWLHHLTTNQVTIKDDGKQIDTTFLSHGAYLGGTGVIEFQLSNALVPYLAYQSDLPVGCPLHTILKFDSKYTIRLYEILHARIQTDDSLEFDLEELKRLLGVGQLKTYEKFSNFKEKALDIAVEEINAKTDLKISYSYLKLSRKVTGLRFNAENRSSKAVETANTGSTTPLPFIKLKSSKNNDLGNQTEVTIKTNNLTIQINLPKAN